MPYLFMQMVNAKRQAIEAEERAEAQQTINVHNTTAATRLERRSALSEAAARQLWDWHTADTLLAEEVTGDLTCLQGACNTLPACDPAAGLWFLPRFCFGLVLLKSPYTGGVSDGFTMIKIISYKVPHH